MSLERELKRALRAQDPGEAFTARVLERVRQEQARAAGAGPAAKPDAAKADAPKTDGAPTDGARFGIRPGGRRAGPVQTEAGVHALRPAPGAREAHARHPRLAWFAAMAATLALTVGGAQWVKHRHELAEGERARAEVLTALRLTSAKLSIVRAAVTDPDGSRGETAH
jgi:hypothetical protein